ncbi:hypothetical protein J4482_01260 [Candidatus Woesearchaeota archaeon]|nr:hypothetical protein [uncultured archaeon]AQS32043.1 hypothetical protein [uncultured archaeon]MBS3115236.1 hypothetical protein [Candidatus Woesearchaeota archaeon]
MIKFLKLKTKLSEILDVIKNSKTHNVAVDISRNVYDGAQSYLRGLDKHIQKEPRRTKIEKNGFRVFMATGALMFAYPALNVCYNYGKKELSAIISKYERENKEKEVNSDNIQMNAEESALVEQLAEKTWSDLMEKETIGSDLENEIITLAKAGKIRPYMFESIDKQLTIAAFAYLRNHPAEAKSFGEKSNRIQKNLAVKRQKYMELLKKAGYYQ